MNLTWVAICATTCVLLTAMGFEYDSWQFWTFAGMIWASNKIGHDQGEEAVIQALADEIISQEKK